MNKTVPEPVWHNFRFLLVESLGQIADLQGAFQSGMPDKARKILDRSGYSENLKMRVRDGCLEALKRKKLSDESVPIFRMLETVAGELDRMTRLCRDCVRQTLDQPQAKPVKKSGHAELLQLILDGLTMIDDAIVENNVVSSMKMVKMKSQLDSKQQKLLRRLEKKLAKQDDPQPVIADIFIAQRIEEMGTALQDIGNAIISTNMGQRLNIEGRPALRADLQALRPNGDVNALELKPLAQTRSGSAIAGIQDPGADDADSYIAVFKDGKRRKLKEERNKVDLWNHQHPGIAPRILGYDKRGDAASLLIEHLPGQTFEHILLHDDPALLDEALKQLQKTLQSLWKKSKSGEPVRAHFMQQLQKRWPAICDVHSWLAQDAQEIAGCKMPTFSKLIADCQMLEDSLPAPHSVLIHGDFNPDNIIYDPQSGAIRFIDLHRSQVMDYVQDISVFMVSNFRLQGLGAGPRQKAHYAALSMHGFARKFAAKHDDDAFEIRLALGLARSFITSTRFILDRDVASSMTLRARYLMQLALSADVAQPQTFTIPVKEIFID